MLESACVLLYEGSLLEPFVNRRKGWYETGSGNAR